MHSTFHPVCGGTGGIHFPHLHIQEDSWGSLCSRPRPFDAAFLLLEVFSTVHLSYFLCFLPALARLLPEHHSNNPFTAPSPDMCEISQKAWDLKSCTPPTTAFQLFLFAKAPGYSCHWAVAGRRTQRSLSRALASMSAPFLGLAVL